MAYSTFLEDQINHILNEKKVSFEAKKMMGGLCYMVDDKMCIGIVKESLMARVGSEQYDYALSQTGCRPMDFTKHPMKGFVFVDAEGFDGENRLTHWIDLALAYNPYAKSSKKKR